MPSCMSNYRAIFIIQPGVLIMVKAKDVRECHARYVYRTVYNVHVRSAPPAPGCHNEGDN